MNQKYVLKCIFSCLQQTRMRRYKRQEDTMVGEKFTALLNLKKLLKKCILKKEL